MSKSIRRFRAAGFCALAVLICELIARPFTTMNVCDDGPYIRMARTFATTGHIVYNGWAAAMMVSQIYLAQPFIKLFGDSYTSIRMSTLLVAVVMAFALQRLLVRAGASERNATLGTLTVVLSPLYLALSVTFMSDIQGFFAVVLCLYGCIRALQALSDRSAIGWICFAVFTCAVFGTSRQVAWLGDLVMVPSTLWLLRSRKRVLLAGAIASALAVVFILGCMHWYSKQPYAAIVPLIIRPFPTSTVVGQLSYLLIEIPLLVLPVVAVFIPRIFRTRRYITYPLLAALSAYVGIAFYLRRAPKPIIPFEPALGNGGSWVNVYGAFTTIPSAPILVHPKILIILTIASLGGLLGALVVAVQALNAKSTLRLVADELSWNQLGILLLPYSVAYMVLMASVVETTHVIFDRYALGLLGPVMIVLVRLYQERVQPNLPLATVLLVVIMAACGIIVTHNTFALDRARVDLADELHATGVPYTAIDGSWDYNFDTELDNSNHLNYELIKTPADAYVVPTPRPPADCHGPMLGRTPHVRGVYGISFLPDTCYGRAPFAPVQYRAWPLGTPLTLYAVRYAPPNAVAYGRGQKNDDQQ